MKKLLYFLEQFGKSLIYFINMALMFLIVVVAVIVLGTFSVLKDAKRSIRLRFFPSNKVKSQKAFYQLMHMERINYTQEQFIKSCEQEKIDPYIAKVFWNFCQKYYFLKQYPYKPKLEDQIALLDGDSLYLAYSSTMEISGEMKDFGYHEIKEIRELLKIIN